MSFAGKPQRWTLYGSQTGEWSIAPACPAPPVPPTMLQFVSVEVMPVSEHEAALLALRNRYTDQRAHLQCACHVICGDVPEEADDTGTCKNLPRGEHR